MATKDSLVVFPSQTSSWTLLDPENDILALLHRRFWGKSLEDRHKEWQLCNTRSEVGEAMDVDSDLQNIDDEETLATGSHVLFMGDEFPHERIWIRREYIRIYDHLLKSHDGLPEDGHVPCAVITGQPGIGKSIWLLYALCRRLAEKEPVIHCYRRTYFLFAEEGVYLLPPNFASVGFNKLLWTLLDPNFYEEDPPPALLFPHSHLLIILTTSPDLRNWMWRRKPLEQEVIVMNPWTKAEIFKAAASLRFEDLCKEDINSTYDEVGPMAQPCFEHSRNKGALRRYRKDVTSTIVNLSAGELQSLLTTAESQTLAMDDVSDQLFLVRRADSDNMQSPHTTTWLNPFVRTRVINHMQRLQLTAQIPMSSLFSSPSNSGFVSAIIWEAGIHQVFREQIKIRLVPMVKSAQTNSPWHTSHSPLGNDRELELNRKAALSHTSCLSIKPEKTAYHSGEQVSPIQSDIYYLPGAGNNLAADSFILSKNTLYIFQFTTASNNEIRRDLLRLRNARGVPQNLKNWCYVFVIPENTMTTCPQPTSQELHHMVFCSTVFPRMDEGSSKGHLRHLHKGRHH